MKYLHYFKNSMYFFALIHYGLIPPPPSHWSAQSIFTALVYLNKLLAPFVPYERKSSISYYLLYNIINVRNILAKTIIGDLILACTIYWWRILLEQPLGYEYTYNNTIPIFSKSMIWSINLEGAGVLSNQKLGSVSHWTSGCQGKVKTDQQWDWNKQSTSEGTGSWQLNHNE